MKVIKLNESYIVKKGDTLYGISNQFGVSVSDLIALNNINPQNLQIGMTIKIPNIGGTNPDNVINYIVRKGDSLYSIANNYKTSVNEIIKLNNLKTNNLQIGQVLKIPETYTDINIVNFRNYMVKKGDNLYDIARKNNLDVNTIVKDNNLNTTNLSIGQILKLRVNKTSEDEVLECFGTDFELPNDNTFNYTVKKGDSLYKIANAYNTSTSSIISLNNLKNNTLQIGQILKIPKGKSNTYIVQKGDTIYNIAKKYNTTVNDIKNKNNLQSNILQIGQKLVI